MYRKWSTLKKLIWLKYTGAAGGAVWKTITGAIVTFVTQIAAPLRNLTASLSPIQDLHGYDAPWPAGGGANQWDEEWETGWIGWAGTNAPSDNQIRSKGFIPVVAGETYRVVSSTNIQVLYYDANKDFVSYQESSLPSQSTFTIPSGCAYIRFYTYSSSYGGTYKNDISINYPSTVTMYSPYSNECPISGRTGVMVHRTGTNVWDEETELGNIDTATGAKTSATNRLRSKNFTPVKPNTSYYFYIPSISGGAYNRVFFYKDDESYISYSEVAISFGGFSFTTPSNCRKILFRLATEYGTTYNNDISINYPSTDHDYHAYTGNTYPITFPETIYGGTDEVVGGNGTSEWVKIVFDGSSDEIWTASDSSNPVYFSIWNNPASVSDSDLTQLANWVKAGGTAYQTFGTFRAQTNGAIVVGNLDNNVQGAYHFATREEFKAYLAEHNLEICYKVATPQPFTNEPTQITTLKGTNTMWVDDSDEISATYRQS